MGCLGLGVVVFLLLLWGRPELTARVQKRWGSAWTAVEEAVSGEYSEPTSRAGRFLEANLGNAVETLLARAKEQDLASYTEFAKTAWPAELERLNPAGVVYFDSKRDPDGDGVIIVVERRRGRDAGILICRQRNSQWQGPHLEGQILRAGPDFGLRRLRKDGVFWHWYRQNPSNSQPDGTAGGSQAMGEGRHRAPSEAGPRR